VVVQIFSSNLNNHPGCAENGCFAIFSSLAQPPLLSRRGDPRMSAKYVIALKEEIRSSLLFLALPENG
jgi:hypothetical protein